MDALTVIYLAYAFIALYLMLLFSLVYIQNKGYMLYSPKLNKVYSLDMVIPCYNEEKSIAGTIEALLKSDYKGLNKIFVVDDCSTDNSYQIIKKLAERYRRIVALQTPKNTGRAASAKNYGAKFVKSELIGFTDADSFPEKDAISKAIGFLDNEKVAGVTALVLVKNRKNAIEKLQSFEYKVIAFTRKLLGFLDAIYVTPGPLAIYKKKIFEKIGGFDERNVTEDIEITWNFISRGYKIEMSMLSEVLTIAPNKFKGWYRQRIRWNVGGMQTIQKYKSLFLKKGSLGSFVLPFFVISWIIGLVGLGILIYNFIKSAVVYYLSTIYSVEAQTAVLTFRDISLTPSVLFFYGVFLFILGLSFTLFALFFVNQKEKNKERVGIFNLVSYTFLYLTVQPILLIPSIYNYLRGKYLW